MPPTSSSNSDVPPSPTTSSMPSAAQARDDALTTGFMARINAFNAQYGHLTFQEQERILTEQLGRAPKAELATIPRVL